MRFRLGAYAMMLAGLSMLVTACGGGGGGGATAVTVTSSKNPVLYTKQAVITANFANYTSTVKFGSPVKFSITSPGKLLTSGGLPVFANATTAKTQAGGIATITITCAQPTPTTAVTPVVVTASSGAYAGSATVTFMSLPATATVSITPQQALTRLGAIYFNVNNDVPITLTGFKNLSTAGANLFIVNPPALPANNLSALSAAIINATTTGFDITTSSLLFKFFYTVPAAATDVPNFAVYSSTITAVFTNTSTVRPRPKLLVSPVYFDSAGKQMFP